MVRDLAVSFILDLKGRAQSQNTCLLNDENEKWISALSRIFPLGEYARGWPFEGVSTAPVSGEGEGGSGDNDSALCGLVCSLRAEFGKEGISLRVSAGNR